MNRDAGHIRQPAVAGYFYPLQEHALRQAIEDAFLSPLGPGALPEINPSGPRRLLGAIVPHAGYPYSAPGAAWAFADIARDGRPAAVVLLGVNHRGFGAPLAMSHAAGWRTPLGVAPIATEIGRRLRELDPDITLDTLAHAQEHSIEVEVPFLQYLFGEAPILPILIGHAAQEKVLALGHALGRLAQEHDLLIMASTDFSHYVSHQVAQQQDRLALDAIAAIQPETLLEVVQRHAITMCGVLPVAALLTAARALDAGPASILHYHTSGDVTGDRKEVVGYGTAVIYR